MNFPFRFSDTETRKGTVRRVAVAAALGLLIPANALAQAAPAGPNPVEFITSSVYFVLLIVFVFWMLVWRPQQLREQTHKKFIDELKKGDEVLIGGSLFGRVAAFKDDTMTVEIADKVRIKVLSTQVTAVPAPPSSKDSSKA